MLRRGQISFFLRRPPFRLCSGGGNTKKVKSKFEEQYTSLGSNMGAGAGKPIEKTSVSVVMDRKGCGTLMSVLEVFKSEGIDIDYISSRNMPLNLTGSADKISMYFDWGLHESDARSQKILQRLKATQYHVQVIGSWKAPWFASCERELDFLEQKTLAAGAELEDNPDDPHPGFHDEVYKERRRLICKSAETYKSGQPIPYLEYTAQENKTWSTVWDKLIDLYPTHACRAHNRAFQLLIERAGYSRDKIPQLQDINNFLMPQTGFCVRPVMGLLSARDFLNGLALRTFNSTQYIRHHSKPLYTPEPDVCHELLGHVPLFSNEAFADFSQLIGLASIGAPDSVVDELARCYWYSVEFGVLRESGKIKAYGAGLLSSFGELQYAIGSDKTFGTPEILQWDPFEAAKLEMNITSMQKFYFCASSFKDATERLLDYANGLDMPHRVEYNKSSRSILTYQRHEKV